MQTTVFKKLLALLIASVLIAAMALLVTGCDSNKNGASSVLSAETSSVTSSKEAPSNVLGEGDVSFTFNVVGADGTEKTYTINTEKETVGAALLELELIAGEDSQYGLYVKTVAGETLDFEKDGKYWALYIGDEYAPTGVDSTTITPGATYTFKAE